MYAWAANGYACGGAGAHVGDVAARNLSLSGRQSRCRSDVRLAVYLVCVVAAGAATVRDCKRRWDVKSHGEVEESMGLGAEDDTLAL